MAKVKQNLANGQGTVDLITMAEELARLISEDGLHEVSVSRGGHRLRMRRRAGVAAATAPASESVEIVPETEGETAGTPVTSLVVGLFHAQKVEPGQRVKRDQVLAVVDSMSIKHELKSPSDGMLLEVLASEGDPVEYGQALLLIAED